MRVLAATDVKNRLGDALSFPDDESLLIQKNGKEAFMAFSASMGKRMVLASYVQGGVSRSTAMKLLGLQWYGELLAAVSHAKLNLPSLPRDERAVMVKHASKALSRR